MQWEFYQNFSGSLYLFRLETCHRRRDSHSVRLSRPGWLECFLLELVLVTLRADEAQNFFIKSFLFGKPNCEVRKMSYVDPKIKDKFESLSIDLKNAILARNVQLNNLSDLIHVLEEIVAEGS